ncbi:MAG TPA: class I SAM-dependent methyltransferase [Kofleriaceae bacterium]|jgi:methylase of polypeptide subunit release factors|nr:class I SAM-dependent methyltransferase [Kofleriaceae bacterium]
MQLEPREAALVELGSLLIDEGYRFITVTPASHARIYTRHDRARSVRDVFGWSRVFEPSVLPPRMLRALVDADGVVQHGDLLRSAVRFSSVGSQLFVHSAFPTTDEASVFFGPDSYRFCSLVSRVVEHAARVVDVCCGSGVGAITLSDRCERITLADINPRALSFARVNAHLANITDRVEIACGDLLAPVRGDVDLVIANPPYLADRARRVYRDGGGELGIELGVRIVRDSLARLAPGGRLILYTGAPIVDGDDMLLARSRPLFDAASRWTYDEIDPDVFGEELDEPGYGTVERIAVVAAVVTR